MLECLQQEEVLSAFALVTPSACCLHEAFCSPGSPYMLVFPCVLYLVLTCGLWSGAFMTSARVIRHLIHVWSWFCVHSCCCVLTEEVFNVECPMPYPGCCCGVFHAPTSTVCYQFSTPESSLTRLTISCGCTSLGRTPQSPVGFLCSLLHVLFVSWAVPGWECPTLCHLHCIHTSPCQVLLRRLDMATYGWEPRGLNFSASTGWVTPTK